LILSLAVTGGHEDHYSSAEAELVALHPIGRDKPRIALLGRSKIDELPMVWAVGLLLRVVCLGDLGKNEHHQKGNKLSHVDLLLYSGLSASYAHFLPL
jgi:hypothetical protein